MASSCLGDRKQVQDARFDSHLTDVKKESFYWRTKIIARNKDYNICRTNSSFSVRQNISNLCQSIFVFLTVYCDKILKH